MRLLSALVFSAFSLNFAGCQDANPRRPVSGTVTFAGAPLSAGFVLFQSAAGAPHCAEAAAVTDGKFSLSAKDGLVPGEYRVEVSAPAPPDAKTAARPEDDRGMARELIPAKYNGKSALSARVSDEGPNEFSFALEK